MRSYIFLKRVPSAPTGKPGRSSSLPITKASPERGLSSLLIDPLGSGRHFYPDENRPGSDPTT
jgi:hypothetical protein